MAQIPFVPRDNSLFDQLVKSASSVFARVNQQWDNWFQQLRTRLNGTAEGAGSSSLTAQSASVSATNLNSLPIPTTGFYRISYSQQVTQAASSSSSLTSSFAWTANGVAQSSTNAAMTGNTTTTHQEGMLPIQADASTNVTYQLSYSSSGGTSMQYGFRATLESLP